MGYLDWILENLGLATLIVVFICLLLIAWISFLSRYKEQEYILGTLDNLLARKNKKTGRVEKWIYEEAPDFADDSDYWIAVGKNKAEHFRSNGGA